MTYGERFAKAQLHYTLARESGTCRLCGVGGADGRLRIGRHPEGRMGQPLRTVGPNIEALDEWIERAGWVCRKCALLPVGDAVGGADGREPGNPEPGAIPKMPPCKKEPGPKHFQKLIKKTKLPDHVGPEWAAEYFRGVEERYVGQYGDSVWEEEYKPKLIQEGKWVEPREWEEWVRKSQV